MKIKLLDSKDECEKWDVFVTDHPEGCFYHLTCWKEVLEKSFNHFEPLYLILENGEGKIRGGMPCFIVHSTLLGKRIVSLPFTDSCTPLVSGKEDLALLIEYLLKFKKKTEARYVEVKPNNNIPFEEINGFVPYYYYYNHCLNINREPEMLRQCFHRTCVRQRIRRAENSNLKITRGTNSEDMDKFYALHILIRKRHGLPPLPYRFFENIWKCLIHPQKSFLSLAIHNGKIIGGIIVLPFKQTLYAVFSAFDPNYAQYSPSHLLFWELIKFGYANGYRMLDFGRTSPDNRGLLDFKRRWGTEEKRIPYFYFPDVQGVSAKNRDSIRVKAIKIICSNLPDPLLIKFGNLLYNHLG